MRALFDSLGQRHWMVIALMLALSMMSYYVHLLRASVIRAEAAHALIKAPRVAVAGVKPVAALPRPAAQAR